MWEKAREVLGFPTKKIEKPHQGSSVHIFQGLAGKSESRVTQNPKPGETHFSEDPSGNLIDLSNDAILDKGDPLPGRGQPGLAGFFGKLFHQLLIKVDDPATCVMEGSAGFARSVIPKGYESSVNFAHAGTLSQKDRDGMGQEDVISIQTKAEKYEPWDKVIYGKKRDPKTLVSYESRYQDKVSINIDKMSPNVQAQLAVAVFASTMVGDESLHTGQFMAKEDGKGNITDIMRIDFGARERFSLQRKEKSDFKHGTSDAYKNSGQFGKDYISYLLKHPDVNAKYLSLWAQKMDINDLGEKSKQEFIQQMNNIPEEKREEALQGVWDTLSKKSNATKPDPLTAEIIGDKLKETVITRAKQMQFVARDQIKSELVAALENCGIDPAAQNSIKSLVVHWDKTALPAHNIDAIINNINDNLQKMYSNQLNQLNKVLTHLQASHQFMNKPHPEIQNKIDSLKLKVAALIDLKIYRDHLMKEQKSFISPDKKILESKIKAVNKAIEDLEKPETSVEKIVTKEFRGEISKSRGLRSGEGAKLAQKLEKYQEKDEKAGVKATAAPK